MAVAIKGAFVWNGAVSSPALELLNTSRMGTLGGQSAVCFSPRSNTNLSFCLCLWVDIYVIRAGGGGGGPCLANRFSAINLKLSFKLFLCKALRPTNCNCYFALHFNKSCSLLRLIVEQLQLSTL